MFLYIMMHIMLAYLILFYALLDAVCLYMSYLLMPLTFANALCFYAVSLGS